MSTPRTALEKMVALRVFALNIESSDQDVHEISKNLGKEHGNADIDADQVDAAIKAFYNEPTTVRLQVYGDAISILNTFGHTLGTYYSKNFAKVEDMYDLIRKYIRDHNLYVENESTFNWNPNQLVRPSIVCPVCDSAKYVKYDSANQSAVCNDCGHSWNTDGTTVPTMLETRKQIAENVIADVTKSLSAIDSSMRRTSLLMDSFGFPGFKKAVNDAVRCLANGGNMDAVTDVLNKYLEG